MGDVAELRKLEHQAQLVLGLQQELKEVTARSQAEALRMMEAILPLLKVGVVKLTGREDKPPCRGGGGRSLYATPPSPPPPPGFER